MANQQITAALIAHDGKKPEMVSFVLKHRTYIVSARKLSNFMK